MRCNSGNRQSGNRRFILITIIAILVVSLLSTGLISAQNIVERNGALSVKGNRIVDTHGQPVVLRGMAFYWSQWKGQFYNAETVKWLRDDWRCTIVRASMAVEAGGYMRNPEIEKEKVKSVVQAALDLGIYVIIDWHDHNAFNKTEAAATFFTEMATLYGGYPNVIYEPWNEPLNTHDWRTIIKPYHEAVIRAIRAVDPDNLIVCGSQTWSQDVDKATLDPLSGVNIAYSLHFYASTHKQALRDKAQQALDRGFALMVTEWGASEASGSGYLDEEETKRWFDFMDKNQLSWCMWSVADLEETSAALKPGASCTGGWPIEIIKPSGILVRNELRKYNP
jgi:endoglucanase